jgi:hypothetical protein
LAGSPPGGVSLSGGWFSGSGASGVGAAAPAAGAGDCPALDAAAFSSSAFSLARRSSSTFFSAAFLLSSFCSRFESCWLEWWASASDVIMKMTAVIDVRRVRKLPAPDDPNTVWLPPPPNAMPMPPPFPACSSTTRIRNRQTATWRM